LKVKSFFKPLSEKDLGVGSVHVLDTSSLVYLKIVEKAWRLELLVRQTDFLFYFQCFFSVGLPQRLPVELVRITRL